MAIRTKQLRPMVLKDSYYSDIEDEINKFLWDIIFRPIIRAYRSTGLEIQNASSALIDAILTGQVYYVDGVIKGTFNSRISKELRAMGGKFNGTTRAWTIQHITPEVQIAIAQAKARGEKALENIVRTIDSMEVDKAVKESGLLPAYNRTLKRMNEDFKTIASQVAVLPELTDQAKQAIADEWGKNLELYVKGWADKAILDMREQITQNTMRGQRAENMEKIIMHEHGVSKKKAKFLARQETSLLMSKYQQQRYQSIGIQKYRWSGADDARERPDHRALNNKIFTWSEPPITDRRTGARNNPGEDYNCRCIAIPIVEFEE